ncbi:unnamed protein product [Thlaspi arvense]|uniref:Pectate lyase n=1 Tax=Thlaspi arvense TaxID=13288 RepID=A0AAU9SUE8_THLAR|nr:unnamed protein product [Thlaspi arvense]
MEMARLLKLMFLFCIAGLIPTIRANMSELDEYWSQRADEAREFTLQAYHSDPYEVVDHFHERHYDNSTDVIEEHSNSTDVTAAEEHNNSTDVMATEEDGSANPEGVGNEVIEMLGSSENNTRRSLRGKGRGKWSKLKGPCTASNPIDKCWRCRTDWAKRRKKLVKCVRGFGHRTTGGKRGRIYVVTSNLDEDMVNPKPGTLRHAVIQKEPLWIIFKNDMSIRLNQELLVMLLGAQNTNEADKKMQVTVAYNHFGKGLVQRMPRIRWGFVHVVNNDYTHWELYAIGGSQGPTILSHGNRFIAPPHKPHYREVTKRDYASEDEWKHWNWRSDKDIFMNGAYFRQSGNPHYKCGHTRQQMIKPKHGIAVSKLTKYAGALDCKVGRRC